MEARIIPRGGGNKATGTISDYGIFLKTGSVYDWRKDGS